MISGSDLLLTGFGKFNVKDNRKRKGRNPQTGETLLLDSRLGSMFVSYFKRATSATSGKWSEAIRLSGVACARNVVSKHTGRTHIRSSFRTALPDGKLAGDFVAENLRYISRKLRPQGNHSLKSPRRMLT